MGKYAVLLVLAVGAVWTVVQQRTSQQTAEKQVERQEEVLARQAARSGLNAILAEAREHAQEKCPDEIASSVGSISGEYKTEGYNHGRYEARLDEEPSIDFAYRALSEGEFPPDGGKTVSIDRLIRPGENREGVVFGRAGNGKMKRTTRDGSEEFGSAPQIRGMGPHQVDLDGDGKNEIPYIRKANQKIEMLDADSENQGDTQELVSSSAGDGAPADDKTRLGTGTWDGSQPSVFYADEDHEDIYRVRGNSGGGNSGNGNNGNGNNGNGNNGGGNDNIEKVVSPGNGAQAVLGIDDIDGDGSKELVFADASQHIRYVESPGGTIKKLQNGGVGSSEGIGSGGLVDLNGDGTVSAIFINGSNNLRVVNADGTNRTIYLDDGSDDGAAKVPPTAIDLDDDPELEIAYVREEDDDPDIEYVDADGSNIRPLCGISVAEGAGLQSAKSM